MFGIIIGSCVLAVILLVTDQREAAKTVTSIRRESSGHGSVTKELQLILDGVRQKDNVKITVQERNYSDEQLQKVFSQEIEKLDERILGQNKSLDKVQHDLDLIRELPDVPIRIEWEVDRYDVISAYGVLNEENLLKEPEGVLVKLKACLIYKQDETKRVITEMSANIYPPINDGEEKDALVVVEELKKQEEATRQKEEFVIPTQIDGKKIALRNPRNLRGWYVLVLGPIMCILLFALERQNQQKADQEKKQQMMLDYPEITDKLTLLLGAGVTVKSAWQKIVSDYERQKSQRGIRLAYEEMTKASHEMQSGVTEIDAYEQFGKRCGLKAYRKLAALLTQNLRKGSKGLSELLRAESEQAFEERKAAAKKRGEEAGTKLLLPMFMMLSMVLLIVIVPAFLSIQM